MCYFLINSSLQCLQHSNTTKIGRFQTKPSKQAFTDKEISPAIKWMSKLQSFNSESEANSHASHPSTQHHTENVRKEVGFKAQCRILYCLIQDISTGPVGTSKSYLLKTPATEWQWSLEKSCTGDATHTIVVLTFRIVILYGDDSATSLSGAVDDGLGIDGFDGEGVDDADVDPSFGQLIGCLQGLHQGDAGTDHCHLVAVRLSDDLYTHSTKRRVWPGNHHLVF